MGFDLQELRDVLRRAQDAEKDYLRQVKAAASRTSPADTHPERNQTQDVQQDWFHISLEEIRAACGMTPESFRPQILAWAKEFNFEISGLSAVFWNESQAALLDALEDGIDISPLQEPVGTYGGVILFLEEALCLEDL